MKKYSSKALLRGEQVIFVRVPGNKKSFHHSFS
jgi:hypothetical protein